MKTLNKDNVKLIHGGTEKDREQKLEVFKATHNVKNIIKSDFMIIVKYTDLFTEVQDDECPF